jgi:enoyl-CoA hydratase/carnithine racemase
MSNEILYETRGPIAIITLNRPESRNAINRAVRIGLRDAFQRFDDDPALRVAILTGAGDKAFSSGMDLKEDNQGGALAPPQLPNLGDNMRLSKPVIAAVNGYAYAGGWLLAQMCDLCVAADTASFAITEGRVGRGMWFAAPLVAMLGSRIALELLLTGKAIDARRAYEIGFVNRVVPAQELMPAAEALANEIIECAPLSVAGARDLVAHALNMGVTAATEVGKQIFQPVYASEDAKEGPRAFREKRKPRWSGR